MDSRKDTIWHSIGSNPRARCGRVFNAARRNLIEVALLLEAIDRESAREKSTPGGGCRGFAPGRGSAEARTIGYELEPRLVDSRSDTATEVAE